MKTGLPIIEGRFVQGRSVLVRVDLDVTTEDNPRVRTAERMVDWLLGNGALKIKTIGHRGDFPIVNFLRRKYPQVEWNDGLRDDGREKQNNLEMAQELADGFDVYIDEAFAVAHREHTSIVALPKIMKDLGRSVWAGLRFGMEIEKLSSVFEESGNKLLIIGGAKTGDKAVLADKLTEKFDVVLRGGLLPGVETRDDGLDISDKSVVEYLKKIAEAQVIVVAGPMGKFEEVNATKGTREIFNAVAKSKAYKVAGGGDTEVAIAKFGLAEKFNWISVGGGAMLEFLANGTLPGIEALK